MVQSLQQEDAATSPGQTDSKTLLHIASDLYLPVEAVTQTFAILAVRGAGKALAIDTPLATPFGWTTMGDIKIGDQLFDENGEICTVTQVHPIYQDHTCYRLRFADGAEIVADAEHLWFTTDRLSRVADQHSKLYAHRGYGTSQQCVRWRYPQLHTTEEIAATLFHGDYGNRHELNHSIVTTKPLRLPEADLTIDPYVLGAWLGDGTSVTATITAIDQGVLDEISSHGYRVGKGQANGNRTLQYRIHEDRHGTPLNTLLRNLNLLGNKHVPQQYLRASCEQRLALLKGLMDTDGGCEQGRAVFYNTNIQLADAVHELAVSLGWRVYRTQKVGRHNGVNHKVAYNVSFRPSIQPFTLPRKFLPLGTAQAVRHTHRAITSVEQVQPVPVRCIAVDSPSHLFLAGRDMVPTHNTYTALIMMEEMLKAGQQVVIIDPVGVCWGLRAAADGEHPGLPIVVLGGDHGDVPLEASAGEIIADFVIDEGQSIVLDLSLFRKGEQARFTTDFAETIYRRSRNPLHILLDEADSFAPQRPVKGQERMLGAIEDLVRRGRARGIGVSLVTQRAAVLNKDVLTQIETLVTLRTLAPQDRAAIDAWISVHGTTEQREMLMSSLPSLPTGIAWFWSPAWLNIFQKVHVRARETFDSSATPKVGEQRISPKQLAPVDLAYLRKRIAATIEQAQASDPRFLRTRIQELERRLTQNGKGESPKEIIKMVTERIEIPVFRAGELEHLQQTVNMLLQTQAQMGQVLETVQSVITAAMTIQGSASVEKESPLPAPATRRPAESRSRPTRLLPPQRPDTSVAQEFNLRAGERKMLEVLSHRYPLKMTRAQLGSLARLAASGGTFSNYFGSLRRYGLIAEPSHGEVLLTTAGLNYLGITNPPRPLSGEEYVQMWLHVLRAGERKMLSELIAVYPHTLTRAELGRRVQIAASGGTFGNYLGTLRRNALVEGTTDMLRAGSMLFDGSESQ